MRLKIFTSLTRILLRLLGYGLLGSFIVVLIVYINILDHEILRQWTLAHSCIARVHVRNERSPRAAAEPFWPPGKSKREIGVRSQYSSSVVVRGFA